MALTKVHKEVGAKWGGKFSVIKHICFRLLKLWYLFPTSL